MQKVGFLNKRFCAYCSGCRAMACDCVSAVTRSAAHKRLSSLLGSISMLKAQVLRVCWTRRFCKSHVSKARINPKAMTRIRIRFILIIQNSYTGAELYKRSFCVNYVELALQLEEFDCVVVVLRKCVPYLLHWVQAAC